MSPLSWTHPKDFDEAEASATPAGLSCEICERLREMEETKRLSSVRLIGSLFRLSCDSISAYNLVVSTIANPSDALATYQAQAEARGVSRQAIHQDMPKIMEHVRNHFPDVAEYIDNMRKAAHGNYQGHSS